MQDQDTALLLATYNGHTRIVQELLKHGADTNLRDEVGVDECIHTHTHTHTHTHAHTHTLYHSN